MTVRRRMRWPCALVLGLGMLAAAVCWASGADFLISGIEHYSQVNFTAAQSDLKKALAAKDLTPALRAKAHFYLGLVYKAFQNREGVLKQFGLAKKVFPKYRPPEGQSEEVLALWQQARPPAAAPRAKAKAKAPRAATTPAPSQGVIWETEGKLVLDRGAAHGVKKGDRFAAVVKTKIRHPVSGFITRTVKVAIVEVTAVYPDSSDAKLVVGEMAKLRAKLQAQPRKCLPIEKLQPKAAQKETSGPGQPPGQQPAREPGQRKIAVLPPFIKDPDQNYGPAGWPSAYEAQKAAEAIAQVDDLPGVPQAISRQQLNAALKGVQGFNPSDYLKETGSLESLADAALHASVDDLLRPPLNKKQTRVLAQLMGKLGADYVLIWGFYFPGPDQQGKLLVCMYEKGSRKPLLVGSSQAGYEDIMATYPQNIKTITWLNFKQREQ